MTLQTRSELEAAIAILDKNRDQQISFAEFFEWWAK
jgi:Ca2+-binding EF-hand superfamily protein